MANETQKLSKEELQEDEFVEGAVRFVEYVQENSSGLYCRLGWDCRCDSQVSTTL